MDQALQILIYLIIIALCLIILLPCLNVVALAFNEGWRMVLAETVHHG